MNYHKFSFLMLKNNRPSWVDVVAISLESARADIAQAFGEQANVIQVSCNFSN